MHIYKSHGIIKNYKGKLLYFFISSSCHLHMNVFANFDDIPSMILQDIKETKRYGHTVGRSDGQRENSIPSNKHSLRGV